MQENQNLELAKTNRVAIWGHISVVIALLFFVIMQASEQTVKPINVTILAVLGIVPIIIEVFLYQKDRESHLIKHFFIISFAIFYTADFFITGNFDIAVYLMPAIFITIGYNDRKALLLGSLGILVEYVIVIFLYASNGTNGYRNIGVLIVQFVGVSISLGHAGLANKIIQFSYEKKMDLIIKEQDKIESMMNSMQDISIQLTDGVNIVNHQVDELNQVSEITRNAMQEVTSGTRETSEAILNQLEKTEVIQEKVQQVTKAMDTISGNVKETVSAIADGNQGMQTLLEKSTVSYENGQVVAQKLKTLDKFMKEMNTIVEMISGIASQTTLLALNANIEAARAGEAGKGFAVVATEISQMANQTMGATDNITDLITNVSMAISDVVQVIYQMIEGIEEEKKSTEDTVKNFKKITQYANSIKTYLEYLEKHIAELEDANQEIQESVHSVSAISDEVSAHANETLQAEENNFNVIIRIREKIKEILDVVEEKKSMQENKIEE